MKIDRDAPVGVFDSGIGGLTVAREIMRNLPAEKIVYFGDTARVPYGSKSKETIIRYSRQIIRFLEEQQVKAIVVACNTASAFALDAVREEFDIPILGVIDAGARVAAQVTRNKRVGVIGTEGTVGSGIHAEVLKKIDPEITVIGKPCPLFVPLVEEGWTHDPVTVEVASRYLKELQEKYSLTYLFISHDLSVVEYISDTVGVMYLGNLVEYGTTEDIFRNPLHPYTEALFSAIPIPDPEAKMNRIVLEGSIPSPANPPEGCKFHTRCAHCMERCKHEAPVQKEVEPGHYVVCHLYDK